MGMRPDSDSKTPLLANLEGAPVRALRLAISGNWAVHEFNALLSHAADSYDRLARFGTVCDLAAREADTRDTDRAWYWLLVGFEHFRGYGNHEGVPLQPSLEKVLSGVFTIPFSVEAIRLESPGWIQLVGSLNPIKVIADFIARWRGENTKRMTMESSASVERERIRTQASIERERIRAEFARDILRLMPSRARWEAAHLIPDVIQHVVRPAASALEAIGEDRRVLRAEVVEAGTPLPSHDDLTPKRRRGGSPTPRQS